MEGGGAVGSGGGPWRRQGEGREPGGLTASPSGVGREQAWQAWQAWQVWWAWLGGMASQEQVVEDSRGQTEEAGSYSKGARKA